MHDPNTPIPKERQYSSKTKQGECKNELCTNPRQNGSSHCKSCSEEFKATKKSQ